jgi:alanine-glyoxylate transaminase / serine-glyoxylate transaminase / serine-pyruvate transaminase
VRVEAPWGQPVDPDALLAAHPGPRIIAVVHAETSTGARSDIAPLGAGKGDTLLLVDCVTSMGGIEVDIDGWDVDVAYAGTQKCLGVAPGLAPLTVSERARERLVERSPSWYLDLRMIGRYTGPATGARTYHHTAPVSMIMSLHAGLGAVLDEGLDAAIARHADCGRVLQDGLVDLGLELFAAEGHRLPELTTVWVPDGVDDAKVRATLLDRYGIEIGGGLGEFAGRVWRIGCMGHTARRRNVVLVLGALAEVIGDR